MVKACIFLANGFEEVEALTVVDILRRTDFDVTMVAINNEKIVTGAHGIQVIADHCFDEMTFDEVDLLILPGGMPGTTHLEAHKGLVNLITQFNQEKKTIAAICAAPSILGKLGFLNNKKATCYPGFEKYLEGAIVAQEKAVIQDGHIITAKGVGVADYFALEIIRVHRNEIDLDALKVKLIMH